MNQKITFWLLVGIFCLGICALCYRALSSSSGDTASTEVQSSPANPHLAAAQSPKPQIEPAPPWLLLLVAAFALVQLFPLLIAWRKAQSDLISQRQLREINFLCETPMFLGLLGSLLGVCLTQFISGSLAAPLAYLTTIIGILLYLMGKFLIWIPLPYRPEYD